jgi:hypothetical protein
LVTEPSKIPETQPHTEAGRGGTTVIVAAPPAYCAVHGIKNACEFGEYAVAGSALST